MTKAEVVQLVCLIVAMAQAPIILAALTPIAAYALSPKPAQQKLSHPQFS